MFLVVVRPLVSGKIMTYDYVYVYRILESSPVAIALPPEVSVGPALREPLVPVVISPAPAAVIRMPPGLRAGEVTTVPMKRSSCHHVINHDSTNF